MQKGVNPLFLSLYTRKVCAITDSPRQLKLPAQRAAFLLNALYAGGWRNFDFLGADCPCEIPGEDVKCAVAGGYTVFFGDVGEVYRTRIGIVKMCIVLSDEEAKAEITF